MNIRKNNKKTMTFMPYLLLIIVVISGYIFITSINTKINELSYSELTKELNEGNVTEISVVPKSASGIYQITGKL